jgi:hypothetical protein
MKTTDYFRTLPDRDLLLYGKEASTFTDAYVTALIERYEDVLDKFCDTFVADDFY